MLPSSRRLSLVAVREGVLGRPADDGRFPFSAAKSQVAMLPSAAPLRDDDVRLPALASHLHCQSSADPVTC